ncbi:dihydrolipoamide acetyltransferase component of pyruvate dehydrogenase complex [Klebsiella michiganensis]|uniref:Dihydrolipoamide acetyltransferase component of pyruvate dehydrogenase complex n=1 Tax=Klebsiella michiganensis TaxID=1134687 RepID=A0A7H4LZW5_9ENTR|nr:dihydrolipoamide acetyltransferase component of pyruvate dehydrogenase complex [Klebsiella michiganensis]
MVKVGDTIAAEQSLITVEGDKASMEVPAPFAGTVKEIKINTGDKVSTGSPDHDLRSGGRSACRGAGESGSRSGCCCTGSFRF